MHSAEADDFDEYDPTPYDGGYDLARTFGRPLPADEEICYPVESSSSSSYDVSYSNFKYGSSTSPSPYQCDTTADQGSGYQTSQYESTDDPYSKSGRKPYGYGQDQGSGYGGNRPKPDPSYGEDYASGYGGHRPKPKPSYGEEEGSGYSEYRPKPEPAYLFQPAAEEGHGEYGRRPKPQPAYGYGEEMNQEEGYGDYGRTKPQPAYGSRPESGFGGKVEHEVHGYEAPPPRPSHGLEQQEQGFGYVRPERSEYGSEQGGRWPPPRSHEEEEGVGKYGGAEFGHGRIEERPSYGEYGGKPSYHRADKEEEGYNRPKYEHDDDDDDEKKRHHRHHRRHDYE